ncbi:MAG: putative sensor domain DACNV-containing protein [Vicinamibacterales bacterium]
MAESVYPAARVVAPRLREHFIRHTPPPQKSTPPPPDVEDIEAVVDTAFWASLRREEGYIPRISVALLPPDLALHPLRFERPLPLTAMALVRVAPAVERRGIHLGVWRSAEGALEIWGTTRTVPVSTLVLEVSAPGLLVVKHHTRDGGKFVNIAVLEGDQVKVVDERASTLPDCPSLLTALLGFGSRDTGPDRPLTVLVSLAVSMRAHGRGGSLLVVPSGDDGWRRSIVTPISYAIAPAFVELGQLLQLQPTLGEDRGWQDAIDDTIEEIAGLTAVDGATVLSDRHELLAFGAKILRRHGSATVEQVTVTEPIEGTQAEVVHPTRLGGTRHLSAAQFVFDQRQALALVASQDGRFTVFAWSPCEDMVHAHRVESLLL